VWAILLEGFLACWSGELTANEVEEVACSRIGSGIFDMAKTCPKRAYPVRVIEFRESGLLVRLTA
jgi:hypothetical protein